jgi:hypothetical protein
LRQLLLTPGAIVTMGTVRTSTSIDRTPTRTVRMPSHTARTPMSTGLRMLIGIGRMHTAPTHMEGSGLTLGSAGATDIGGERSGLRRSTFFRDILDAKIPFQHRGPRLDLAGWRFVGDVAVLMI